MEEVVEKKKSIIITNIFFIALLSVYGFILNTISEMTLLFSGRMNNFSYIMFSVYMGTGALLFAIAGMVFRSTRTRKVLLFIVDAVFVSLLFSTYFHVLNFENVYGVIVMCVGFVGGFIYYLAMAEILQIHHGNLIMLVGVAVSYVLQLISEQVMAFPKDERVILGAVFFLMIFSKIFNHYIKSFFEEILPFSDNNEREEKLSVRRIRRLVGSAFLIVVALGVPEVTWTSAEIDPYIFYSWPRLAVIFAIILVGYTADRFGVLAVEKLVMLALIFSFVAVYNPDFPVIRLLLFNLCEGILTSYLILGFWILAPATKQPFFWASGATFVKTIQMFFLFFVRDFTPAGMFCLSIAQVLSIALMFWILHSNPQEVYPVPDDGDAFGQFCDKYHFTPRERDVMRAITTTEDTAKALCVDLDISERMFYRYIRQMCDKVGGVDNRNGLVKLYYTSIDTRVQ